MPELPEVETTVRGIKKYAIGKTIVDCWTDYDSEFHKGKENIKDVAYFAEFKKLVVGRRIVGAKRRAKNVLIHLSEDLVDGRHPRAPQTLLIHMKMTGHVLYGNFEFDPKKKRDNWTPVDSDSPLSDPFNRFIHFVLVLGEKLRDKESHCNAVLALSDMRKFAKVTLIETSKLTESVHLSSIGPEPLEKSFTLQTFTAQLSKLPKAPIKSTLMDQSLIAGIGNIYSDEILWRAGVHPESIFSKIPKPHIALMFEAMKATLEKGIDFGGDSMSDYRNLDGERGKFQEHHEAYRRKGLPCRKRGCNGTIIRKIVRGRSGHFCDTHQVLYK